MKINFSINYKGYTADISYEPEDKIYVGEVRCISDSLNFHGRSILEVNAMFHQSIENYLDLCKQIDPMSRKVQIKNDFFPSCQHT